MKYVVFEKDNFIIIPETMNHSDVSIIGKPVSAGFCMIEQYKNQWDDIRYKVSCWGNSTSLNLQSRKEDNDILSLGLR